MENWRCKVCGYVYKPAKGDKEGDVPPGTPFDGLDEEWVCPVCSVDKSGFAEVTD